MRHMVVMIRLQQGEPCALRTPVVLIRGPQCVQCTPLKTEALVSPRRVSQISLRVCVCVCVCVCIHARVQDMSYPSAYLSRLARRSVLQGMSVRRGAR